MVFTQTYQQNFPIGRTAEAAAVLGLPFPWEEENEKWLIWLMFEGFIRQAESEFLELVEFHDLGEIEASDIPPAVDQQLGRRAEEYIWRHFEAVAQRGALSNWLEKESVWKYGQTQLATPEHEQEPEPDA